MAAQLSSTMARLDTCSSFQPTFSSPSLASGGKLNFMMPLIAKPAAARTVMTHPAQNIALDETVDGESDDIVSLLKIGTAKRPGSITLCGRYYNLGQQIVTIISSADSGPS